jgi:hypothetical protein
MVRYDALSLYGFRYDWQTNDAVPSYVYLGDTALEVGELQFSRQGQKEVSAFRYSPSWLSHPDCFALSPDLPLSTD